MKHEVELKLQAWMDNQLSASEADEIARLVETDAHARALLTELKNTRSALAGFEDSVKVPESREFYWSKISRAIDRETPQAAPAAREISWGTYFRRLWIPAGLAAAILLLGTFLFPSTPAAAQPYELSEQSGDSDVFTYSDEASGTTLIWFSYSGENKVTDFDVLDIF